MSNKYLIFAGTSEGHQLAKILESMGTLDSADFCVATEYGEVTLNDVPDIRVISGRKDVKEIEELLQSNGYDIVIDATHPYAELVTSNIKKASSNSGIEYKRLCRSNSIIELVNNKNIELTKNLNGAIDLLNKTHEKFLLTTGTKELMDFSKIRDFSERAVARVLPSIVSINACIDAGLKPVNIICMQGPFTEEMNLATMRQFDLKSLVTKNTGIPGGLNAKTAMADHGYRVIVIDRPVVEDGYTLEEIVELIKEREE